ncbi:MAG: anthrax toxin lethal factor-related metalloendopeptidase, partial [Myxococcaceae bacterium]
PRTTSSGALPTDGFGGRPRAASQAALLGQPAPATASAPSFVPRQTPKTPGGIAALELLNARGYYLGEVVKNEIVDAFERFSPDRQSQFLLHLDGMLKDKQSWIDLSLRFSIAADTGYLMVDSTLEGENRNVLRDPTDTRGWSTSELETLGAMLKNLPPKLKNLPSLTVIERDRDASAEGGSAGVVGHYSSNDAAIKVYDMQGGPAMRAAEVLSGKLGEQMTLIHEIGHAVERSNPELADKWRAHYETLGATAASPTHYGRNNAAEGFAEAFLLYSTAPDVLRRDAPASYDFMQAELGDSTKGSLRNPFVSLVRVVFGSEWH